MKRAFLLNVNSNFSLNVHLFHSTVKTWAERAWKKNEIQRSLAKKNRENSNFGIYLFIYLFIGIYRSLIYLLILIWNKRLRQAAQTHLNKLLTLQKRALRLMHFADNREHAIPIFIATNIMPKTCFITQPLQALRSTWNSIARGSILLENLLYFLLLFFSLELFSVNLYLFWLFHRRPAKNECMKFSWKCQFFSRKYDHFKRQLFLSIY